MSEEPEQAEKPYSTEQFAFVDESPDDSPEVSGWLSFMNSRAGRKVDRREQRRERLTLIGVTLGLVALVGAVVLWSPWSSGEKVDTGHSLMPSDRVAVLLQVSGADASATSSAILLHDRRGGGRSALVTVPADLVLPVEGEGRLTVRSALAEAGPTLTREALAELLGVPMVGSWVLDGSEFTLLVDRLGGLRVAGQTLSGAQALQRVGTPDGGKDVFPAIAAAFPGVFTAGRDLLVDFGILAAPGLPVDLLGAVVTGLSRDGVAGRLGVGALPLDASGHGLDVTAALPVVRDLLGGEPGQGRGDATPRILVQLAPGAGVKESDVRADVLNAGFEYVDGGTAPAGATRVVLVRSSLPDAQALGESIATTLGLPLAAVRLSDDVPFTADVLVVLVAPPTVKG
ncbi:hypothetical protein [Sporichthya sp.]|uniref:hypothetical protein n=1 Tax=Sporichthya sp. TaxID=65475 RepID=UPI00181E7534|nr:hypothetical protein [Sporichthya sp.]MBA3742906.1 hypothetical protein [Sporichthya sp.]